MAEESKGLVLHDVGSVPDGVVKPKVEHTSNYYDGYDDDWDDRGQKLKKRKKRKRKKKKKGKKGVEDTQELLPLEPGRIAPPDLKNILLFAGFVRDEGGGKYKADHGHHYRSWWTYAECKAAVGRQEATEVLAVDMFVRWLGKPEMSVDEVKEVNGFTGWYHKENVARRKEREQVDAEIDKYREELWDIQNKLWQLQASSSGLWREPTLAEFERARAAEARAIEKGEIP